MQAWELQLSRRGCLATVARSVEWLRYAECHGMSSESDACEQNQLTDAKGGLSNRNGRRLLLHDVVHEPDLRLLIVAFSL